MLTISTIQEALAYLTEQTKHAWTDSELFDIAANSGIELHAAAPIDSIPTIHTMVPGEGMVEKFRLPAGHSPLAVLFPWQVGQLWLCGETKTSHPSDHDRMHGEYKWFVEPVSVTRSEVRIRAESLREIQAIWMKKNEQIKPDAVAETSEERKNRIKDFVNTAKAKNINKTDSFKALAESGRDGEIENIRRIYYDKDAKR